MSTNLPAQSTELAKLLNDPLLASLAQLYDDPEVTAAVSELRLKIIDRFLTSSESLEGIDMLSEHGNFVFEGIAERLRAARTDLSAIGIEMCLGDIQLLDAQGKLGIGNLSIPCGSAWARQDFVNTNPIKDVDAFTVTPYGATRWHDPYDVTKDSAGPAFALNDREAVAAQILMVVNAALGYKSMAISALEEDDVVPGLRMMKFDANKRDLFDALEYAVRLKEELRSTAVVEDPSVRMIRGMSECATMALPSPQ